MIKFIKKLTLKSWIKLGAEILLAITIFMALSLWQERNMLSSYSVAPTLSAQALDGQIYQFPEAANSSKRTLIYFFAPWCKICHLSIGNLNILRDQIDENDLSILIVALDWNNKAEVEEYMVKHELNFPVLLGNLNWQQQYKIKGFPSYYILDQQGKILSGSMGYSTSIGMFVRSKLN